MAGSIKWFIYEDDAGETSAIKLDESNTEAVNGSNSDFLVTTPITVGVPRNIKPREVFYSNSTRTRTIRCVPLNSTVYAGILAGDVPQIADPLTTAVTLTLIRANGERRTLPFGNDTGQDDGDAT